MTAEKRKEESKIQKDKYFADLVEKYYKLVYFICIRAVKNPFDAEDLTQETFLSVYSHMGNLEEGREKIYICRTATNKVIDFQKKRYRQAEAPLEEDCLNITDSGADPQEQYLLEESKKAVERLCSSLKSPYKETAYKYFVLEKTSSEIAMEQKEKLKTVQVRIYRIKQKLKKSIEGRA